MKTEANLDKNQTETVTALALSQLRKVTGLGEHMLRESTTFEEIGLESLAITAFVSSLEPHFPGLSKTFIFDCRNILDVAAYLLKQHPQDVERLAIPVAPSNAATAVSASAPGVQPMPEQGAQPQLVQPQPAQTNATAEVGGMSQAALPLENAEWPEIELESVPNLAVQREAIAIIGMDGRFPGADSLDEFWQNLYAGRDAISEIPRERWPLEGFFEEASDSRRTGLSYAKWGGFLSEFDKFDAQFFGISSREADQMDPQERLFLECAWHGMENASLFGERAENLKEGQSYKIGVFVGLTTNTYSLLTADHWRNGAADIPAAVPWSAANRVSFAFNLSGPSLAVDTACSSSLVALHLACESIARGECKAAIAGGVNLYFHPAKYIQLCQLQMLSPTGRCHTFGAEADGFVPGEGVGAIVLKPLSAAQADGDRILGVIRGTSVNHCGRTNGYTVPNSQSQAELIKAALSTFDVPPSSISYVEAHGTGTKLGDPIEFTALTETLAGKTSTTPCGMGSVKSNIGHLESAAGIAGIIKVLLQLEHQSLAPSLGSRELNPGLDMTGSRFFVPQAPAPWQPDPRSGVRRAGVSSFGAGGANGHVIIEEAPVVRHDFQADKTMPLVFPVSARSEEQLHALLLRLLKFIESEQFANTPDALYSLAYVLQCGRRHHAFRFVAAAENASELARHIAEYLQDPSSVPAAVLISHIRPDEETDMHNGAAEASSLPHLWSQGVRVSWNSFWVSHPPLLVLPLYPFARERHWISSATENITMPANKGRQSRNEKTSTAFAFTGEEYWLRDHQIGGKPIFPAAGYFNLFQEIAASFGFSQQVKFHNIVWMHPFRPDGADVSTIIGKAGLENGNLSMEFVSPDGKRSYCRADCSQQPIAASTESLQAIRARCTAAADVPSCYALFDELDMVYGPAFRGMQSAWVGKDEALVEIHRRAQDSEDGLEPGMLDSIFQGSFVIATSRQSPVQHQFIPYSIKGMRVHRPLGHQALVHVKERLQQDSGWSVFDYTVFNAEGELLLEIDEFRFRNTARKAGAGHVAEEHRVHQYQPVWQEAPWDPLPGPIPRTLVFDHTIDLFQSLQKQAGLTDDIWLAVPARQFQLKPGNIVELDYRSAEHLDLLWRMFIADGGLPANLVFNLATPAGSDSQKGSWETYAGLDTSRDVIEVIRSACRAAASPRFHAQIHYQLDVSRKAYGAAIAGFLRAVAEEVPGFTAAVVGANLASERIPAQQYLMELASPHSGVQEVRWESGKRHLRRIVPESRIKPVESINLPAAGDVVVVTGGAGAIAQILAESLSETSGIRIALLGHSPSGASTQAFMERLRAKGVSINYWRVDCADRQKLGDTLAAIRSQFGPIAGVLHCAGVLKDAFFLRQEASDWDEVLKAKVLGAMWLDELTRDDPIKWFMVCSGLAGVRGNVGQSVYGLGNAWLNVFAEQRQAQVARFQRKGNTMAIAWSLWDTEGGMQPPQSIIERYARKGLIPLSREDGVKVFENALRIPHTVLIPIKGKPQAIEEFLQAPVATAPVSLEVPVQREAPVPVAQPSTMQSANGPVDAPSPDEAMIAYLAGHLSQVTKTPVAKINPDVSLEAFGLDSILVMELNDLLEKDFPQMPKTVLFEARNLRLLAKLLIDEHRADAEKIAAKAMPAQQAATTISQAQPEAVPANEIPPHTAAPSAVEISEPPPQQRSASKGDNIAIIGIAGRYPGASNLQELWEHLAAGRDLVTDIPNRWAMPEEGLQPNPMYAKWGGFIDDFDRFDPLFFGISPRDAERMDPQERLFLQTAWHTLEDAGYTPESLSGARDAEGRRKRVGVIVGVMYGEYQLYNADATSTITNSSYASIANRVSYCLDLDGPSFAIDSMCSSSLTSISLACDQLRSGRCDAAIAGGVNLSIHPHKYRMLCELNFASTDGRCRSFGEGGDGYVPGEGVGAVLLKRLEDAERDGDHIYAVIQGSDIGHGAKTSGYTVPNADAQADVIRRAFERSGVDASRLSYVEAHGTGTSLGDPIEIRGMTKALGQLFKPGQQCAVGSIKSNIGHLESAAGIAAVSKVVLQLQHGKLAPSIHSDTLNANIDFSKTPFHVQRELADWRNDDDTPRLTAISSFGAGGANAHIVLEEYVPNVPADNARGEEIFLFSARSHQQLSQMVENFIGYLDRETQDGDRRHISRYRFSITDVAMTLLLGRRHLRHRLAVPASDFAQLRERLQQFLSTCAGADPKPHAASLEARQIFYGDAEEQAAEAGSASQAWQWAHGNEWQQEISPGAWRKVPLPGYEFLRNRYWVATEAAQSQPAAQSKPAAQPQPLPAVTAEHKPPARNEQSVSLLTPNAILDRVAQGLISHEEARSYLLSLSKTGEAVRKETTH